MPAFSFNPLGATAAAVAVAITSAPTLVSAQLRRTDAMITWYERPGCSAGLGSATGPAGPGGGSNQDRTIVIANQGFCQRVPNSGSFPGYKIDCNGADGRSGIIQFCQDTTCAACNITANFNMDSCYPNDFSLFGSSSFDILCPNKAVNLGTPATEEAVPAFQALPSTDFDLNWFENPGCGPNNTDRTIVIGRLGFCHRVPNAPGNEGYRVTCNAGGASGTIQYCTDMNCASCPLSVPFNSEQCLANDYSRFGSASYAIRCPAQPSPLPRPPAPAPAPAPTAVPTASAASAPASPASPVTPAPAPASTILSRRPADFRITWYEMPNCAATVSTLDFSAVVGTVGFCNAVPDSPDSGYRVFCEEGPNGARTGRGSFQVCQDYPFCSRCNVSTPFVDQQCLANPPEFGSSSVQFQCTNPLLPPVQPFPGRALLTWFEFENCNPTDRTLVEVKQDWCQRVPRGRNAGYKVSCDANGQTGTYSVCTDENCGDCPVTTRFRTDQCLPNPPQYGSASVSIRCPGAGSDFQPGQAPGNGNTTIRIITTAPSATLAPASSSGPSTGAASGDRSSTGGGSSGAAGGVAVGAGAIVAFVMAAVAVMRME